VFLCGPDKFKLMCIPAVLAGVALGSIVSSLLDLVAV